jgi:hypothetical protein
MLALKVRRCRVLAERRQELLVPCRPLLDEVSRGGGRVAVSLFRRLGPRFRGFAGRGSGRGVVVPPVRTEVSKFQRAATSARGRPWALDNPRVAVA